MPLAFLSADHVVLIEFCSTFRKPGKFGGIERRDPNSSFRAPQRRPCWQLGRGLRRVVEGVQLDFCESPPHFIVPNLEAVSNSRLPTKTEPPMITLCCGRLTLLAISAIARRSPMPSTARAFFRQFFFSLLSLSVSSAHLSDVLPFTSCHFRIPRVRALQDPPHRAKSYGKQLSSIVPKHLRARFKIYWAQSYSKIVIQLSEEVEAENYENNKPESSAYDGVCSL